MIRMQCVPMIEEYVSHLLVFSRIRFKTKIFIILNLYGKTIYFQFASEIFRSIAIYHILNVIQNYKKIVNIGIKFLKGK